MMLREEFKKVFRSPLKWVLAAVLLLNWMMILVNYLEFSRQVGNVKEYNRFAGQYEGALDLELAEQCRENLLQGSYSDHDGAMKESTIESGEGGQAYFYSDYWMAGEYWRAWNQIEGESENRPVSYEGLKKYLNNESNKEDPVYPIYELELSMLEKTGAPNYFYNIVGIKKITSMVTGGALSLFSVLIGMIVAAGSLFSIETSSNMGGILLSSKNGRKEIMKKKMAVAEIVMLLWVSVYYWISVLLNLLLYGNLEDLAVPLNAVNSFYMSPYALTVGQYLVIAYLFYLAGVFATTAIFSIIFVAVQNTILSIGVSLLFFLIPLFLPANGIFGTVGILFPNISMQANMLFQDMQAIAVLGKPVLLCCIAPVVSIVIGVVMCLLVPGIYLKRNLE